MELLAEWVETFPYDFRDERLMSELKDITHICAQINPSIRAQVSQLLQNLLLKLKALENYETHIRKLNSEIGDRKNEVAAFGLQQHVPIQSSQSHKSSPHNGSSAILSMLSHQTDVSELCSSPLVLAQQLTHIELEKLSHIG